MLWFVIDDDWCCALFCCDLILIICYYHDSFLILFGTIKAEIALTLQVVNINTHFVMTRKRNSLHYSNSFPSPLPHTHLFLISLKKKHIEGGRKKKKNIFYTLSFSRYHPHRHTPLIFISLEKNKNIRKGGKE